MTAQTTPRPHSDPTHVAVIGGGIAGLSAAYHLHKAATAAGMALRSTLLEADDRLGGKLLTEHVDGYTIEGGPDSFITQKPAALRLARELGLEEELVPTQKQRHSVFVYQEGRMLPLPEGVMLIVPTQIMPFALSPLFSWPGKLRMGLDLLIPPRKDDGDETLAAFISRRLGREALDRLAEPLMAGIYNAEAGEQSILATFPRFRAIEKKHGSLIRGMLAARRRRPPAPANGAQPPSVFMSLRGGVGDLAAALAGALQSEVRLQTPVLAIEEEGGRYRLRLPRGETLWADQVILATPAYASADLLAAARPDLASALRQIRYVSTGTISLAYRRTDVPCRLDAYGLVIPRSAGCRINALTWSSVKWPQRAPEDHLLLRAFFGGSRHPEVFALPDGELLALAREEIRTIMGVEAAPALSRIYRWPQASPQYDVGHVARVEALQRACPPGLHLASSAYRGVGIPDCIEQGQAAAGTVVRLEVESSRLKVQIAGD